MVTSTVLSAVGRGWSMLAAALVMIGLLNPSVACAQEAAAAAPIYPISVATAPDGAKYIVDRDLPGVWKVVDGKAEIFFQGPKQLRQPLNAPRCVAVSPSGEVFVGDSAGCNVFRIAAGEQPVAVSPERIGVPMALAFDAEGNLFVADIEVHRVLKLTFGDATQVETVARVRAVRGLAIDAQQQLWVLSGYQDPVRVLQADGSLKTVVAGTPFPYPASLAFTTDGKLWISDSYAHSVSTISAEGEVTAMVTGDPLVYPVGLCASGETVLVADPRAACIWKIEGNQATRDFPQP